MPPASPRPSLLDRLQSSAKFRAWARAFPLTRPVARRRAADLFDLCAGFVYAQVLYACVELKLFSLLAGGPLAAETVAARIGLPLAATERLLAAAISLRLVSIRRSGYGLGALGAAMVGNDGVAAMIAHHAALYADMGDPVGLLRAGRGAALSAYWPYATAPSPDRLEPAQVAPYSALMAASQPLVAAEILDAYPFRRHRALLDVGGGEGAFLQAVAARVPGLRLHLFDLPAVAARARTRLGATATVAGGDMFAEPLPRGADVVSLVRVLHDHDDPAAMALLRAVHAALPPGGTLVLAEPLAGTPGAQRMGEAYFGFYLLAMGAGRPRSAAILRKMLEESGFGRVRQHRTRTPLICGVLSCVNLA